MTIVKTIHRNGSFVQVVLAKTVPGTVFHSIAAMRNFLCEWASKEWGIHEGRDYRIRQALPGCLIPIYAVAVATGETIEII
jgi:hypothetical protein